MGKLLTVMQQEYLSRVRTRGFLIGTISFPILMVLLMTLPAIFMNVGLERPTTFAVVDSSNVLLEVLTAQLPDTNDAGERLYTFQQVEPGDRDHEALVRDLGRRVDEEEDLGGFLILPADLVQGGHAEYYAPNVSDMERNEKIRRALDRSARMIRIERSGLPPEQVQSLLGTVRLGTFRLAEGEAKEDQGQTFGLAYVVGFVFYMSLILYGQMTLRTSLEEKVARTAELMVSTVRPIHLMGGKVLGVALLSLTQLAIWGLSGYLIVSNGAGTGGQVAQIATMIQQVAPPVSLWVYFLVFFILGFLFYSGLFVSVGAMVNSETEAQQLQFPVMLPIIIALMLMFLGIRDPNQPFIQVVSFIPFFSPIVMMVRICVLSPPAWEIALSLTILVLSVAASIWLAGRIVRVGLLMYGKRPNLPELMKWIRYG